MLYRHILKSIYLPKNKGGMSVDTLVHSPLTKGLITRAIGQSGSLVGCFAPANVDRANGAYRDALRIGARLCNGSLDFSFFFGGARVGQVY